MLNQKDRKLFQLDAKENNSSKSVYNWLAQYDEEGDFLCGKVSNSLLDITEEE